MIKQPPTIADRTPAPPRNDHNGTLKIIRSRRYREWRQRIAMQRLNRCEVCWDVDGIITPYDHMHHIRSRQECPELVMDEANVQLLCITHHDEIHSVQSAEAS